MNESSCWSSFSPALGIICASYLGRPSSSAGVLSALPRWPVRLAALSHVYCCVHVLLGGRPVQVLPLSAELVPWLSACESLYDLDGSPLSDRQFANIFSKLVVCSLILLGKGRFRVNYLRSLHVSLEIKGEHPRETRQSRCVQSCSDKGAATLPRMGWRQVGRGTVCSGMGEVPGVP